MLYFITNESEAWLSTIPDAGAGQALKLCNTETGEISKAPRSIRISPWGSVCLLADKRSDVPQLIEADDSAATPVNGRWQIRRRSQTLIEDGDFLRRTISNDAWR